MGDNPQSRRDARHPYQARVQLKVAGLDAFVERFSENISASGMFVATRSPLPVGRVVQLRVVDPHGGAVFEAVASVVWSRPPRPDAPLKPGMGLRFAALNEQSREIIERICGAPAEVVPPQTPLPTGPEPVAEVREDTPTPAPDPTPDPTADDLADMLMQDLNPGDLEPVSPPAPEPVPPPPVAESTPPSPPATGANGAAPKERIFAQRSEVNELDDVFGGAGEPTPTPTLDSPIPQMPEAPVAPAPVSDDEPLPIAPPSEEDVVNASTTMTQVPPEFQADLASELLGSPSPPAPPAPPAPSAPPAPPAPPVADEPISSGLPDPFAGGDDDMWEEKTTALPTTNTDGPTAPTDVIEPAPAGSGMPDPFSGGEEIDVWGDETRAEIVPGERTSDQLTAPTDDDTVYVHASGEETAPSEAMQNMAELMKLAEVGAETHEHAHEELDVSNHVLGIDFGTSSSSVAVWHDKKPEIVRKAQTDKTLPSAVQVTQTAVLVGGEARNGLSANPTQTIEGVKKLLGRKFFSRRVQRFRREVPYEVVADEAGDAAVRIDGQVYPAGWFATELMRELRLMAKAHTNENVVKAVFAVPGYFTSYQRHIVVEAARVAGFEVEALVNETTAVAVAYAAMNKIKKGTVLVYDLGAGGFTASVVKITKNHFEVLATGDSVKIGGKTFDNEIVSWMLEEFQREKDVQLAPSAELGIQLQHAAEEARIQLTKKRKARIQVPVTDAEGNTRKLDVTLKRKKLEALISEHVEHTLNVCRQLLTEAKVEPKSLAAILMSGRCALTPLVQAGLKTISKKTKKGVAPADAVAMGAAVIGEQKARGDELAIQEVLTQDVGVAIPGGRFKPAIERNTRLIAEEDILLATSTDNQQFFSIDVYQGHGERVEANEYLGTLEVSGLAARPKGGVQLHFHFTVDMQGALSVDVTDNISQTRRRVPMVIKGKPPSLSDHARLTRKKKGGVDIGNIYRRRT